MGMMIHRRREGHLHYPKNQVETKVEEVAPEVTSEPEIPEEIPEVTSEPENKGVVYTRDEINKLPFFSLKSLAVQQGIDVTGKKGYQLKDALIEKMGL